MFNKDNFKVFTWSEWMGWCLYVAFLGLKKVAKWVKIDFEQSLY